MHITPLGDSALLIQVCERLAPEPETTVREVVRVWRCLEAASLPGVLEVAPAYTTLAVYYDQRKVGDGLCEDIVEWLCGQIADALAVPSGPAVGELGRTIEIPVCYGGTFGPDLADVARHARLTEAAVIERHSSARYLVHCLGFTPGFAYLSGLPAELAMPRRASPRRKVPAGAVGIGGTQTGVYPLASPGGWQLIGWTPLSLFDPRAESPTLLRVGDRVRFRPVQASDLPPAPAV
jgi:inhibitor of KinA